MPSEIHSIRDSVPKHLTNNDLGQAVQSIVQAEGVQASYLQYKTESASQFLPGLELDKTEIVKLKKEKALLSESAGEPLRPIKLEGGAQALIERTDGNGDHRLSRQEILSRLRSENLPKGDGAALKTMVANYDRIDTGNNGIDINDISNRERTAQTDEQNIRRLDAFRRIVQARRQDLDGNHDGRVTESELGSASRSTGQFSAEERRVLDWAHDRWD